MINSNSTATSYISTDNWSVGTSATSTTISTGTLTTGTDVGVSDVGVSTTTISAEVLSNRFAIDANNNFNNSFAKEEKKNRRMKYHSHDAFSFSHEQICYGTDALVSYLLPEIKDVKIIKRDEKDIGVLITFSDDSIEKAVVTGDDTFNLEYGITICLFKRMLADSYMVKGHETGVYNKLVEHVLKEMKKKDKERKEAEEKAKAEAEKERKFIKKKRRAKARRERRRVDILADAIAKAMKKNSEN